MRYSNMEPVSKGRPVPPKKMMKYAQFSKEQLLGRTMKVQLTSVDSPEEFSIAVHTADYAWKLEKTVKTMNDLYQSVPSAELLVDPIEIGMPCAAAFHADKKFYRAEIKKLPEVTKPTLDDTILIRFVDFGNTEQVPIRFCKQLRPEFIPCCPALAIESSLKDAWPPRKAKEWPAEAAEIMERFLELEFDCKFVSLTKNGRYDLELFSIEEKTGLLQILIQNGVADPDLSSTLPTAVRPVVPTSAVPAPVSTRHRPPMITKFKRLELNPNQMTGKVALIFCNGPEDMYIQMGIHKEKIQQIAQLCRTVSAADLAPLPARPFPTGMPCLAWFETDSTYNRAEVQQDMGPGGIRVHFVDFGNEVVCQVSQLRSLPDNPIFACEALAVNAKLDGVVGKKNENGLFPKPYEDAFSNLVNNSNSQCRIIRKEQDGKYVVDLQMSNGESVADKIILSYATRQTAVDAPAHCSNCTTDSGSHSNLRELSVDSDLVTSNDAKISTVKKANPVPSLVKTVNTENTKPYPELPILRKRIINLIREKGSLTVNNFNTIYGREYGSTPWRKILGCRFTDFITKEMTDDIYFDQQLMKAKSTVNSSRHLGKRKSSTESNNNTAIATNIKHKSGPILTKKMKRLETPIATTNKSFSLSPATLAGKSAMTTSFSSISDLLIRIRCIVHLTKQEGITFEMLRSTLVDLYGFCPDPVQAWNVSWGKILESFLGDICHRTTNGWKLIDVQYNDHSMRNKLIETFETGYSNTNCISNLEHTKHNDLSVVRNEVCHTTGQVSSPTVDKASIDKIRFQCNSVLEDFPFGICFNEFKKVYKERSKTEFPLDQIGSDYLLGSDAVIWFSHRRCPDGWPLVISAGKRELTILPPYLKKGLDCLVYWLLLWHPNGVTKLQLNQLLQEYFEVVVDQDKISTSLMEMTEHVARRFERAIFQPILSTLGIREILYLII